MRYSRDQGFLALSVLVSLVFAHNPSYRLGPFKERGWTPCTPQPRLHTSQCVIGYGSLMNRLSKHETTPISSDFVPLLVFGYNRAWSVDGTGIGYSTIYLGASPDPTPDRFFNAVMYQVLNASDLQTLDEREVFYCRELVSWNSLRLLVKDEEDTTSCRNGQIWIYTVQEESSPSCRHPIVQSYLDLAMEGALSLERRVPGFTTLFLETTAHWNHHWVMDRVYPRNPYVSLAYEIDKTLLTHPITKSLYEKIPIEGSLLHCD